MTLHNPPHTPLHAYTILGAGLMGRLLAVSLARQGHQVTTYDRSGEHRAGFEIGPEGECEPQKTSGDVGDEGVYEYLNKVLHNMHL